MITGIIVGVALTLALVALLVSAAAQQAATTAMELVADYNRRMTEAHSDEEQRRRQAGVESVSGRVQ